MKKEKQESCHKVIKFCNVKIFISYILFLHTFYKILILVALWLAGLPNILWMNTDDAFYHINLCITQDHLEF